MNRRMQQLQIPGSALVVGKSYSHTKADTSMLAKLTGQTPELANGGVEAVQKLLAAASAQAGKAEGVSLVVCDDDLRDMSAWAFIRLVRLHPRLAQTPIFLASADSRRKAVLKATDAGFSGYLLRPYSHENLFRLAQSAMLEGARNGAQPSLPDFERALKQYVPDEPPPAPGVEEYEHGLTALGYGHAEEAIRCFRAALAKDNTMADAYVGVAKAWRLQGRPDRYREWLQKGAEMYLQAGRASEAQATYELLLKIDPNAKDPFSSLASTYIRQKKYKAAARLLTMAFPSDLTPHQLYNQVARDCYFTDNPQLVAHLLCREMAKIGGAHQAKKIMAQVSGPRPTPELEVRYTQEPQKERGGRLSLLRDVLAVAKYTYQVYKDGEVVESA